MQCFIHSVFEIGCRLTFVLPVVCSEFSVEEKKRQQDELDAYQRSLDDELQRDQERHKRNVEALNKRKEDMIKDRKQKMKDDLEQLKVSHTGSV